MVLEAAGNDSGGKSGLMAENWLPQGRVSRLKATANRFGAALKHQQGIHQPQQRLIDVGEMVRNR
jgi:hypothetical protein